MTPPQMITPGPDHPIAVVRGASPVAIKVAGHQIGESLEPLILHEARYTAVPYIPRGDLDMSLFSRTATVTHCPYKGDATYFSITIAGQTYADAAWSYETPYPAVDVIAGHIAFFPDRVDVQAR
jgi:uncharacterized protein (DUF427 family)